MTTWTTFTAMTSSGEILLDLLDANGVTAGWIVRRSCNVFQAFTFPTVPADVVDLERDGRLVGIYSNAEDARQAILDALAITEPQLIRVA